MKVYSIKKGYDIQIIKCILLTEKPRIFSSVKAIHGVKKHWQKEWTAMEVSITIRKDIWSVMWKRIDFIIDSNNLNMQKEVNSWISFTCSYPYSR